MYRWKTREEEDNDKRMVVVNPCPKTHCQGSIMAFSDREPRCTLCGLKGRMPRLLRNRNRLRRRRGGYM